VLGALNLKPIHEEREADEAPATAQQLELHGIPASAHTFATRLLIFNS